MKPFLLVASFAIGLVATFAPTLSAAEHPDRPEAKVTASIRPKGKFKTAQLPALTHITFEVALKAAVAAVPGAIVKAELEIEDGNLMYSFEMVGADQKITEVEIDAGNGQVLDIDRS